MELLQYLPRRYKGETVYSMAARLVLNDISVSTSRSLQNVFHNRNLQLDSAFPSFIPALAEKMGCSCDELVQQHSLFPYFSVFANGSAIRRALTALLNGESSVAYKALGLLASRLADEAYLKYCPVCATQQKVAYGETYWRREHQLPMVNVCVEHHCKLIQVSRKRKQLLFPESDKPSNYDIDVVEMKLAEISTGLLSSGHFETAKLLRGYAARLFARGLATTKSVHHGRWFNEMFEYFSLLRAHDDRVAQLFSKQSEHGFPANVFYSDKSSHHPIKHVLIICFLFEHFGDFVVNYSNASTITTQQSKVKPLKQSEIDQARYKRVIHYLNQNLSLRQIVKNANVSAATVRNIARSQGITLTSSKRKINDGVERLITIKLMVGWPTEVIAARLGVSKSDGEQVLSGHPEIKALRQRIRHYRKRHESRDSLLETVAGLSDLRVKHLKDRCYRDYMWLYKNDRAWLFDTLKQHSFSNLKS